MSTTFFAHNNLTENKRKNLWHELEKNNLETRVIFQNKMGTSNKKETINVYENKK